MPTINPKFLSTLHELTTIAVTDGMNCPLLPQLYDWAMKQNAPTGQIRPGANIGNGTFGDAVLSAVRSSPDGISAQELRPILAHWGQPATNIGTALGRLAKAGNIEQKGQLWFATAEKKVNRTLAKRRAQKIQATGDGRRRRAANPATTAGNQLQAAAG